MTSSSTTPTRLSAIIIAKDEARDLPACLASLAFCDEIVVVDSGSTDDTVAIAEAKGCRVLIRTDWAGFGAQKQRALDAATGDWVLSIDADEVIPHALAAEIRAAIETRAAAGYRVNRLNSFLGKPLRHGGWYPDRHLRLARRDAARFTKDLVHEALVVDGTVGDLATDMPHQSYRDLDEVLDKQHRYALSGAEQRRLNGRNGGVGKATQRAIWMFIRLYVVKRGFLDGREGFLAAVSNTQEVFWRYAATGKKS
ncbi:glycosyltransferase family 2 protein [Kaistia terrae]|uniref:Glycosyltransferase family 2 protein n=1 Tax=Kaistia terrae TaxID=537017 RepID=A0ABW0PTK3_9HYPH|nr:glycosyltransferase family 2 protein [Kaistia terrae]MCX5578107.1 glycosyltransferase family 2 protein [Kaistia terrae]